MKPPEGKAKRAVSKIKTPWILYKENERMFFEKLWSDWKEAVTATKDMVTADKNKTITEIL